MNPINRFEADVLLHTSQTGRYVTDEAAVITMAARGLLRNHGPQALAGGMHYFTMSSKGREALNWLEANACRFPQPKPKRKPSRAFECWRNFRDMGYCCSFSEFWKQIWPTYEFR